MRTLKPIAVLVLSLGFFLAGMSEISNAQSFGMLIQRKKIVLERKLPPTGRIDGTTIKVLVTATGFQADVPADLKSTLESILIRNDDRLRTEDGRADTVITCRVTSYAQPPPQITMQSTFVPGSKTMQNQPLERVTGMLAVSFQAKDGHTGVSLAADNVTAKFDMEYTAAGAQEGFMHSMTRSMTQLKKGAAAEDKPPTPIELHDRLIQDAAQQIASHLVNTTEQVEVYLARGGGLDEADKLMEQKLWTRALEQLETMKPFDDKEEDAYRLYNLGVVNEALGYQTEDVRQAEKYLQEASIDYGKAIDGKPTEKYFLQPQTRIDTALAHYKILGDQKTTVASDSSRAKLTKTYAPATTSQAVPSNVLTNDQIIAMVAAKLDESNIIDTIQHADTVRFNLTAPGEIDLAKNGVSGRVITAMKERMRRTATHRPSASHGPRD